MCSYIVLYDNHFIYRILLCVISCGYNYTRREATKKEENSICTPLSIRALKKFYMTCFVDRQIYIYIFSLLTLVKKEIFFYMNIAFSNIFLTVWNVLFGYIYYFVHFIYAFNILPLLGQNILGKINKYKIMYQGKFIQFLV